MLNLFSKSLFGVEVSNQSIKIAELKKKGALFYLENYALWSDNANKNSRSLSVDEIAEAISSMLKSAGMSPKSINVVIPVSLAFSSIITVPAMSEAELQKAIPYEAKQYIPIPTSEVQIDWINLGKLPKEDKLQILLMAIPNSVINKYLEVGKKLNLKISSFELDIFSQMRSLDISTANTLVLDLGARHSSANLITKDKKLVITRSFDVGGTYISKRISEALGITLERAEELKFSNGMSQDPGIASIINTTLSSFILNDLFRVLDQYKAQVGQPIDHILLTGGLAKMRGIEPYMRTKLAELPDYKTVKVDIAQPLKDITIRPELQELFKTSLSQDLSSAIGIAMKSNS